MARPVRLFASSSPYLAAEREALGQVAAEIPIRIGWEIKHTPGPHDDSAGALAFLTNLDVFVLILGGDFAAPMGLEWQMAESGPAAILAYRKRTMPSPSAKSFLRQARIDWSEFSDPAQLKTQAMTDLSQLILDRAEHFGLVLDEIERLAAYLDMSRDGPDAQPDRRRGAERGGVILGRAM